MIKTNIDEISKDLEKLSQDIEDSCSEEHSITLTDENVSKHTGCSTVDALYNASGILDGDPQEVAEEKIDKYLSTTSTGSLENLIGLIAEDLIFDSIDF